MKRRLARSGAVLLLACVLPWHLPEVAAQSDGIPEHPNAISFSDQPYFAPSPEGLIHRLGDGTPVVVVTDPSVALVDVTIALPRGFASFSPSEAPIAALAGAMMRRAGAGERALQEFDAEVDFLALRLDLSTGLDRSGVRMSSAKRHLARGFELMADVLAAPLLDPRAIDAVRGNLLASLEARNDNPITVLRREWAWLGYGSFDHPRTAQLRGSSLSAFNREALATLGKRLWSPEGAVVAVAGDTSAAEVLPMVERLMKRWRQHAGRAVAAGSVTAPFSSKAAAPPGLYWVDVRDRGQAKVLLGGAGPNRDGWQDPTGATVNVLAEVLGGDGLVSRLRSRLRAEEGLVYTVRAALSAGLSAPGVFEVYIECDASKVAQAVQLTLEELDRLREEPVSDVELQVAKRSLIDAYPSLWDEPDEVAGRFAEDLLLARPHAVWRERRPRIQSVQAADVRRLARKVFDTKRLRYLVVSDPSWMEARSAGKTLEQLLAVEAVKIPLRDPLELEPSEPLWGD